MITSSQCLTCSSQLLSQFTFFKTTSNILSGLKLESSDRMHIVCHLASILLPLGQTDPQDLSFEPDVSVQLLRNVVVLNYVCKFTF